MVKFMVISWCLGTLWSPYVFNTINMFYKSFHLDNHFELTKKLSEIHNLWTRNKFKCTFIYSINSNACCIAKPQHGRKKTYWSYRDATGTAEQLAKSYTTLIWGRLLCDATIKSYRVNKWTRVDGLAECITDTSTWEKRNNIEATATRPVPLNSS